MKKNDYQNLMEHIQPPAGLNDRVLQTARQEAAGVGTRRKRTALRAAVCAACALALVLGTVRLAPSLFTSRAEVAETCRILRACAASGGRQGVK